MKSQWFILAVISLVLSAALILHLISKANHFEKEQSITYDQNTSLSHQPNSFTETLSVSADPSKSPLRYPLRIWLLKKTCQAALAASPVSLKTVPSY